MKIVGVTACPTGIAHTYMAAIRLSQAAKSLGHEIKIETQGAMGVENPLSTRDIENAEILILAADIPLAGESRFAGRTAYTTSTQKAIEHPESVIEQALTQAAPHSKG